MSASLLSYLCEKETVGKEVDETIFDVSKIEQGELLTINCNTVCEGDGTFEKAINFSIVYCLCRERGDRRERLKYRVRGGFQYF